MSQKRVLDVACGSKMFWFDKDNPDVEFCDNREVEYHEYYPNRYIEVKPDTVCDFTALPFEDGSYKLVVFDPPHLERAGDTGWTALKYGCLKGDWKEMLRKGFSECFRVLDDDGVLVFKWSEVQIPLREILPLSPYPPLFGHRSGKNMKTHWLCFMKPTTHNGEAKGEDRPLTVEDLYRMDGQPVYMECGSEDSAWALVNVEREYCENNFRYYHFDGIPKLYKPYLRQPKNRSLQ